MHLHGPVPLDDPIYAERGFETALVKEVQAGHWVLLLGPRQHGKTSAFLRVRKTLSDHATSTALVDLQKVPPFDTYAQLVTWFANQVAVSLGNAVEIAQTDAIIVGTVGNKSDEHIATAKRMKADGHMGKAIAKYLGVSRATLYRHLNAEGAA